MVRELNMNTQRQNFWKESIHKEATVRLLWHMKFSKEFARNQNIREHYLKKQAELSMMKTAPVSHIGLERYPKTKKAETLPDPGKDGEDVQSGRGQGLATEMRPVTPSTRELLFKGFSALGEGRHQYLRKRKEKKPEEKYEYPVTSGWEYGWKIGRSMGNFRMRPAEFGRTRIIKESFYRTNGVLPVENISS